MSAAKKKARTTPALTTGRAWSYSRLMDYERCPQLYKFKAIDKLPEPGSPAMDRGSDIHKQAELYLTARSKPKCPDTLKRVEPTLKLLRRLKAVAEDQWAFTQDLAGETSWFGASTWARLKIDAVVPLPAGEIESVHGLQLAEEFEGEGDGVWIVDWKTGKFRPEASVDQLELYNLGALLKRPTAPFVLSSLVYTDVGQSVHAFRLNGKNVLSSLKKKWIARVQPLQKDKAFKPTPSDAACYWCFFSKKKGGPCKAG